MAHIRIPRDWESVAGPVTPEERHLRRREVIQAFGLGGLSALSLGALGCGRIVGDPTAAAVQDEAAGSTGGAAPAVALPPGVDPAARVPEGVFPAARNDAYAAGRPLTPEEVSGRYNNFYEFTTAKDRVWKLVDGFATRPWTVEVTGLVAEPRTLDIDDLLTRFEQEERVYRFRCVEAWAMTVPWTGLPLKALVDAVQPRSSATHVRFWTKLDPEGMPGARSGPYAKRFPYYEGLTMAEATNELTLLATGIYGHQLPRQHGAPLRLVVPWKYGFKSIKSVVRIEFTDEQPATFWNDLVPDEYDFVANVDPTVPHPRWSQASERLIDTGERIPTLPYNGYGAQVAHLYES